MIEQVSPLPAPRSARTVRNLLLAGVAAMAIAAVPGSWRAAAQTAAEDPAPGKACAVDSAPRITVVTDIGEFAYDHSRSIEDLAGINSKTQDGSGHALGLTRQLFGIGNDATKTVALPQEDGSVCVGFTDGTIAAKLETTIFVVRELKPGSCLYDQVLAHEERHAKVGRRLFSEFAEKLEAGIAAALREQPFVRATDPDMVRATAEARMREIIEPLYRDFRSVYRKRQAIIDTSGEFARVEAACPGEIGRLVGQ